MKMADVLRNLADELDGNEQGGEETTRPANTGPTADHFQHDVDDGAESGDQDVDVTGVMIPPLQAKLELLKKATGVDNVYDSEGPDELDDIKKLTGIKAVVQHVAGEDNDIVG
jgi:hypothetical protein